MEQRDRFVARLALLLLLLYFALLGAGCGGSSTDVVLTLPPAPNASVFLITFDALRADALGVYGYDRPTSPRIDAFAQEAVIFDQAHSAARSTPTSFAASFTGLLPTRSFLKWQLDEGQTLAEVFQAAGYTTVGFFNNVQLTEKRRFDQGFDQFHVLNGPDQAMMAALEEWFAGNDQEKLFVWMHFISPHTPYEVYEMSAHFYDSGYQGRFQSTTGGKFEIESPEELERVRDLYDGEVFFADHLFGRTLDLIHQYGHYEDSLVLLSADHGEEFMEHGKVQHSSVYQEVIRIPLILRHPSLAGNFRTVVPYSNVDLLPTLATMVGIPYEPVLDGRDLTQPIASDRPIVSLSMTRREDNAAALKRGPEKLVARCLENQMKLALYDLEEDPGERQDLSSRHFERAEQLLEDLQLILGGDPCRIIQDAVAGRAPEEGLTDEEVERLRALGYVN